MKNSNLRKKRRLSLTKDYYGYIFIAPFVLVFLIFIMYPIINTFYLSFTNARISPASWSGDFIGLEHYRDLLGDRMFRRAVSNTWMLWIFNFIPQMILALVLAAMFTSTTYKIRGAGVFKALFYLPNLLMPVTVAALFFSYLSLHGPVNQLLVGTLGVWSEPRDFLTFVTDTRVTVIFLQTWMWFGQTAIVLVAGMTSISPSFYESGMIDGANQIKMFIHITIPLLKPILLFVLVTSLVGGLQMFEIPMLISDSPFGNPMNSVLTVNMFMNIRRSFPSMMIGNAAAISVLLFLMSSAVALIIFWSFREPSEEALAKKEAKKRDGKVAKS